MKILAPPAVIRNCIYPDPATDSSLRKVPRHGSRPSRVHIISKPTLTGRWEVPWPEEFKRCWPIEVVARPSRLGPLRESLIAAGTTGEGILKRKCVVRFLVLRQLLGMVAPLGSLISALHKWRSLSICAT